MSDCLQIKNFGPIKDAKIELKPFLVIIGGQGTGKSTIAKVLTICQELFWYIQILEESKDVLQPFHIFGIADYFQQNSYIEFRKGSITIVYEAGKFILTDSSCSDKEELLNRCKSFIYDEIKRTASSMGVASDEALKEFIKTNSLFMTGNRGTSFYIPAERNLAGTLSNVLANILMTRIPLPLTFLNYLSFFEKARNEFPVYDLPFLPITYKVVNGKEGIIVSKDGKEEILPLNQCSSGIQSLLPMLMILDFCIKKELFDSYVIEEPEQNLFPDNQLAVLRYLIERMKQMEFKGCHTITTHSPYLLSGINISLLAGALAPQFTEEVNRIVPDRFHLKPGTVGAYALGGKEVYCKDIINPLTGTIDQNYLDATSSAVGSEFAKLYRLYIKSLKSKEQ